MIFRSGLLRLNENFHTELLSASKIFSSSKEISRWQNSRNQIIRIFFSYRTLEHSLWVASLESNSKLYTAKTTLGSCCMEPNSEGKLLSWCKCEQKKKTKNTCCSCWLKTERWKGACAHLVLQSRKLTMIWLLIDLDFCTHFWKWDFAIITVEWWTTNVNQCHFWTLLLKAWFDSLHHFELFLFAVLFLIALLNWLSSCDAAVHGSFWTYGNTDGSLKKPLKEVVLSSLSEPALQKQKGLYPRRCFHAKQGWRQGDT